MSIFNIILRSLGLPSLVIGVSSVLAGIAAALIHGNFELLPATLCILFSCAAQMTSNATHRYYDSRYNLGENIDDGIIDNCDTELRVTPMLRECSVSLLMITSMLGLAISAMAGWWALAVGIGMLLLGLANTAGPNPLGRTPYSPLSSFLFFGPVAVIGTSLVQSGHEASVVFNWYDLEPALYMAGSMGLFAVNCHILHDYANYERDLRNSKRTLPVASGRRTARTLVAANGAAILLLSVLLCSTCHMFHWGLVMTTPLACTLFNTWIARRMRTADQSETLRLQRYCSLNMFAYAALGMILFAVLGVPDDSTMTFFGH